MPDYSKMIGHEYEITIDRPLGSVHPKFDDIIYPVNYGYIERIKAGDGDDVDVYVLGSDKPIDKIRAKIIAIVHRTDDNEDKLVAAIDDKSYSATDIESAIKFQEKFFEHKLIRK